MRILSHLLVLLVALVHVWFMVLEMILWDHPVGRQTFNMTPEFSAASAVLAANRFVRAANWDALRPFMEEWVSQWNTDDLYRAAQAKRVPFAPASTLADLVNSDSASIDSL